MLARLGFYVLFLFHLSLVSEPALKGDVSNLSMQNIAMSIFWWLASNLKLAYRSEVCCNLSLMIGSPVIDGGTRQLPTTRQPSALSRLPSGGEAARIFEMCFDHRSSQKALILYWPKMKGIRCKNPLWKAISIYRWCFVCLFSLSPSLPLARFIL